MSSEIFRQRKKRTLRILRFLCVRSIFFILKKASILQFFGCNPPYSERDFQKRKATLFALYVFCFGFVAAFYFFFRCLAEANMDAAMKLVLYIFLAMVLFVLYLNAIFRDHFFVGNFVVKVIGRKSFELHDSFQSTNPQTLYNHAESAVNELFRNGADSVIMKSHILGGLTSLQIHRLGGLLRKRCIGAGYGLLSEPITINVIGLLIGWISGIPFRSRCSRELVLLRSLDGFNPKQRYIRLF